MTALGDAAEDYLRIRRALGYKLGAHGWLLRSFVTYMDATGASAVTVEHALRWATVPRSRKPVTYAKRLGAVRAFTRYLHTIDPATELLASDLLPWDASRRTVPYIYSPQEITALMAAAGRLKTRLVPATMRTLIGLLAVTGMRLGEAIRLDRDDLELPQARLIVRNSKFGKSRQLPLHPTTIQALRDYLFLRDRLKPQPVTPALLIGTRGGRLDPGTPEGNFRLLRERVGLGARPGCAQPRLHDLRHLVDARVMRPV
jgi:integrase